MKCYIMINKVLAIFTILTFSRSVILNGGAQNNVRSTPDFDFTRYQGKWVEVVRSKNLIFEGKSAYDVFTFDENKPSILGQSSMTYFGKEITLSFTATWHHDVPRTWDARLNIPILNSIPINYTIIDTDYDNYSVVYSKNHILHWDFSAVWIMARSYDIHHDILAHAISLVLENTPFKREDLVPTQ